MPCQECALPQAKLITLQAMQGINIDEIEVQPNIDEIDVQPSSLLHVSDVFMSARPKAATPKIIGAFARPKAPPYSWDAPNEPRLPEAVPKSAGPRVHPKPRPSKKPIMPATSKAIPTLKLTSKARFINPRTRPSTTGDGHGIIVGLPPSNIAGAVPEPAQAGHAL